MPVPDAPKRQNSPEVVTELASMMTPTKFSSVGAEKRFPIAPNKPFLLRHNRAAWRVSSTLEEPTMLPDVTMHVLEPGVNGVRTISKGEDMSDAYKHAVWRAEENGWTYISAMEPIPSDCLPNGVPSGSYLRELPCEDLRTRRQGLRYVEAWNIPTDTLPGEVQEFSFDLASYERWLLWLVESGVIAPVPVQVERRQVARVQGHLERVFAAANLMPEVRAERIRRKKEIVERYEAAAANRSKPADDAPPKKRGRK